MPLDLIEMLFKLGACVFLFGVLQAVICQGEFRLCVIFYKTILSTNQMHFVNFYVFMSYQYDAALYMIT